MMSTSIFHALLILGPLSSLSLPAPTRVSVRNSSTDSFVVDIASVWGASAYNVSFVAFHNATDSGYKVVTAPTAVKVSERRSNILYQVSVTAINDNETSLPSTATARTAPNGVEVLSFITTPTFITIFLEQIPGVTAYQVEVTNTNNPTDTRVVAVPDGVTEFHYLTVLTGLQANTNYSVRARASEIDQRWYNITQSPYGSVKSVKTDMISVFGSVTLLSGSCNAAIEPQLLAAYQTLSSNVIKVKVLPDLTSAPSRCQHEIFLADQTLPPEFASLNLAAVNKTRYQNSVVKYNVLGSDAYGVMSSEHSNRKDITYYGPSCSSSTRELLTIYIKTGALAIASVHGYTHISKTIWFKNTFVDFYFGAVKFTTYPLNASTIYAFKHNYLVETCNGVSLAGMYDRIFSMEHSTTASQDKNVFIFTSGPPAFSATSFKLFCLGNGSQLAVAFPSNILNRAVKFTVIVNGTTATLSEWELDSSSEYQVVFQTSCARQTYEVAVGGKARSANGTLLFTEITAFTKESNDYCLPGNHNCSENARCQYTADYYQCICNKGFTGDGHNCSDVNECLIDKCGSDQSFECQPPQTNVYRVNFDSFSLCITET